MEFLEQDYPELTTRQQQLDKCYETAAFYQEQLDAFEGSFEARQELGNTMVSGLDLMYPMNGEMVWLAGHALVSLVDDEGMVVGEDFKDTEGYGIHMGFNTVGWQDGQGVLQMKIMHQILVGEKTGSPFQTVGQRNQFYKFFSLESAVFSLEELEETLHKAPEVQGDNPQNYLGVIADYSKHMEDLLRSTTFRRFSWRKQKSVFGQLLETAIEHVKIRDLKLLAEPEYVYAPVRNMGHHFVPLYIGRQLLGGTCLGVDAPVGIELRAKPIRRNSDNPFLNTGLCLVIDPDEEIRQNLHLSESQVLYIPTYDQEFDAVLLGE